MIPKRFKPVLAVAVMLITAGLFVYYFVKHPKTLHVLGQVPPLTLLLLAALYCVVLLILVWNQRAILNLCDLRLSRKESLLVVTYSTIVNFFGPLQSGPGFRAAYLKKRHNLRLKPYTFATFIYYGFFAAFSGLMLILPMLSWPLLLGCSVLGILLIAAMLHYRSAWRKQLLALRLQTVGSLALATLAQLLVISLIYFIELRSVSPHTSYLQALSYTGAANFALFVSVTPGAIGIRESFLLFSQHLHHIGSATIVTASLVDRGVYVIFLGLLFIAVLATHAKDKLKISGR